MDSLRVTIDRTSQTAVFSGDTFNAKEEIKQLGLARWDRGAGVWRVTRFTLATEKLQAIFPNLIIDAEVGSEAAAVEPTEAPPASDPPAASGQFPESYSVGELSAKIRALINEAFPAAIFVRGVLSSVKRTRGYVFMDLAEEERPEETLNCAIWRNAEQIVEPLAKAGFELEADLQVMFEVRVSFYPRRGTVTLEVVGVVPEYTVAKLAARREQTNERLRKEGLFERNKQLALPVLPKRLGLLTSSGGTVIHDFRSSLDAAEFGFELYWCCVSVQGSEAKNDILRGLGMLNGRPLDAILIFRGGGSAADLAVFNEYEVAKAVCMSRVPVISAIGHQEDQSSVQDVSWLALGVPKDIGRYFADIVIEHRRNVDQLIRRLAERAGELSRSNHDRLLHAMRRIHLQAAGSLGGRDEGIRRMSAELPRLCRRQIVEGRQRLEGCARPVWSFSVQRCRNEERTCSEAIRTVQHGARAVWQRYADRVDYLSKLVEGASPETQLRRGFALVRRRGGGAVVTSAAQLKAGEDIDVQFRDAARAARVLEEE